MKDSVLQRSSEIRFIITLCILYCSNMKWYAICLQKVNIYIIDPHKELSQTCHFHIGWASLALVGWFGDRQRFIQPRHRDKYQVRSSYGSTGNQEKVPPTLGIMHVVPCQGGSDQRGHKASGLMFRCQIKVDYKPDIFWKSSRLKVFHNSPT